MGRTVSKHKHTGSKSQAGVRRKPQKTMAYENAKGDRYRIALDMGWGDPYWNAIKRRVFTECVMAVKPTRFIYVQVLDSKAEAFEAFCGPSRNNIEWFKVRARHLSGVTSHFFLHNVSAKAKAKLSRYSKIAPTLRGSVLEATVNALLDWKLQPQEKRTHRFKCSDSMREKLRTNLIEQMWENVACDPQELAHYIKADTVFGLRRLSRSGISDLLDAAGLSPSDRNAVLKELAKKIWEPLLPYKGLPEDGAREDALEKYRGTPMYKVSIPKDRKSSYSKRRVPTMGTWDTIPRPRDRKVYL